MRVVIMKAGLRFLASRFARKLPAVLIMLPSLRELAQEVIPVSESFRGATHSPPACFLP